MLSDAAAAEYTTPSVRPHASRKERFLLTRRLRESSERIQIAANNTGRRKTLACQARTDRAVTAPVRICRVVESARQARAIATAPSIAAMPMYATFVLQAQND